MYRLFTQKVALFLLLVGSFACQQQPVSEKENAQNDPTEISDEERMARIKQDFSKSRDEVLSYIRKYYPDVTDKQMTVWESEGSLEWMDIDGEKRYFANAAPNLFRINAEAREIKEKKDNKINKLSGSELVNFTHLPTIIKELKASGKTQTTPIPIQISYTLTVDANAVPEGEIIRCWLPYPREDNRRQTEVQLLSVNDVQYTIAPVETLHRTLYMEKRAIKDEPTVFNYSVRFKEAAEWFNLKNEDIKPYDTKSKLFQKYTCERKKHVHFSPEIRKLSEKIVGNETRPLEIVRRIFTFVNDEYPWASAREYSTMENIPAYVLKNKHGDCGMVSLTFITLCRLNGIPAKWQSGFMLHPKAKNLHDWAEVYFEGIGWIPVDQSFGIPTFAEKGDTDLRYFFMNGIDTYRWIVNDDFSAPLVPAKQFTRSETVDFQRGEVEWKGGNLYFDQWSWKFDVKYEWSDDTKML